MNASKETARQAFRHFQTPDCDRTPRDNEFIEEFFEAAISKLPTEGAYKKDALRRKKAKSK